MIKLELCTESLEGVKAAGKLQLDRVELCSALEVGGLTPNFGLIKASIAAKQVQVHVMIRPRTGGFIYSNDELKIMEEDVLRCAELGADGVVFGVLSDELKVSESNREFVKLALKNGMEATFHRAFDMIDEKNAAIEKLIDFGFTRVLTSGGAKKAIDGLAVLENLQKDYGNQIELLVGSGVNSKNAKTFIEKGIQQLHFTARKVHENKDPFDFGKTYSVDETKITSILNLVR